jgi:hypothetical protein
MKLPLTVSWQRRAIVVENGTMKAGLVLRPAISQTAMPAKMLNQNGA